MPFGGGNLLIHTPALIDLRVHEDFCQGHLPYACNLPMNRLADRMHQLPDTSQPLVLCGSADDLAMARHFLTDKGYQVVQQQLWHDSMAEMVDCRSARLWQASPLVESFVTDYASHISTQGKRGLDLACGAGRDAVYLAMNGWQMLGVDHRQDALTRVHQLAESQQVSVETLALDLETGQNPFSDWDEASFDLINVARYLHRPLFPYLKNLIAPQGVIIYHTFMQGSERFGSPKNPNFLLRPNELADCFDGWTIWQNRVMSLADGRPMSYFIAQKPAD